MARVLNQGCIGAHPPIESGTPRAGESLVFLNGATPNLGVTGEMVAKVDPELLFERFARNGISQAVRFQIAGTSRPFPATVSTSL